MKKGRRDEKGTGRRDEEGTDAMQKGQVVFLKGTGRENSHPGRENSHLRARPRQALLSSRSGMGH
jgi:hypothetical protein